MKIELIQGEFNSSDTLELLSQMIQIKIKYHENKILSNSSEEEIKWRESKIKRLQNKLQEIRNYVKSNDKHLILEGIIHMK